MGQRADGVGSCVVVGIGLCRRRIAAGVSCRPCSAGFMRWQGSAEAIEKEQAVALQRSEPSSAALAFHLATGSWPDRVPAQSCLASATLAATLGQFPAYLLFLSSSQAYILDQTY
jgi:hypothetical protein